MAEEKLELFEFAATTMSDPRPLLLWNMRWGSLAASEISRWQKRPWIILFDAPEGYRLGLPESNGYPVLTVWRLSVWRLPSGR